MGEKTFNWDPIREALDAQKRFWVVKASCQDKDTNIFYDEESRAKNICKLCPVRSECLEYALGFREEYGVWGGASEAERKRLLRKVRALHTEGDLTLKDSLKQIVEEYIAR